MDVTSLNGCDIIQWMSHPLNDVTSIWCCHIYLLMPQPFGDVKYI